MLFIYFIFGGTMFGAVWLARWLWNYAVTKFEKHNKIVKQYGKEEAEGEEE